MQITHEQFMEVAISGFAKEEWKYDSRDLLESIKSIKDNVHKLFQNGTMILSIYTPHDNCVSFDVPTGEFNHLAAIRKMEELKLIAK